MLETIKGSKVKNGLALRKPKEFENDRRCAHPGCLTIVSKYNRDPKCWLHQPKRRIRIRGSLPSDDIERERREVASCRSCNEVRPRGVPIILEDGLMHMRGDRGRAAACEER